MHELTMVFALIGVLGVGAQWLAWRLQMPAIVLMLVAGLFAGPVTGMLHPAEAFGAALGPMISVAVALILFEGGLSLDLSALGKDTGDGLKRMVFIGGPLAWGFSTVGAHLIGGLSLPVAAVFGGILVVTGPTVVIPLLRQARLAPRAASLLHWEAIVNDPVGALFAVLAFEAAAALAQEHSVVHAAGALTVGIAAAALMGWAMGRAVVEAMRRGLVPEYMKAPVLLALVLAVYAAANALLEESGLLSVTIMGLVIGNARLPSIAELRRFKEHIAVLLVSGVFILLASSLDASTLLRLDWRAGLFVVFAIVVARPLAVMIALSGSQLTLRERALVGWVAPRGVVAVAVSGFFGAKLVELGYADGASLAPIAFALVATTVLLHGFSVKAVALRLGLRSTEPPGVLIVGATDWTAAFGAALKAQGVPVLIADHSWRRLYRARQAELPVYYGEILSEAAEHSIELERFGAIIAATENDAYNALVCTDFGPEFGRHNVFQLGRADERAADPRSLPSTLGGRTLLRSGSGFDDLNRRIASGWTITKTRLTDGFTLDDYLAQRAEDAEFIARVSPSGVVAFSTTEDGRPKAGKGDTILNFSPPKPAKEPSA